MGGALPAESSITDHARAVDPRFAERGVTLARRPRTEVPGLWLRPHSGSFVAAAPCRAGPRNKKAGLIRARGPRRRGFLWGAFPFIGPPGHASPARGPPGRQGLRQPRCRRGPTRPDPKPRRGPRAHSSAKPAEPALRSGAAKRSRGTAAHPPDIASCRPCLALPGPLRDPGQGFGGCGGAAGGPCVRSSALRGAPFRAPPGCGRQFTGCPAAPLPRPGPRPVSFGDGE